MATFPRIRVTAVKGCENGAGTVPSISIKDLDFWFGEKQVLFGVSLDLAPKTVTAIIGPSGCGKSTILRTLNRIYELYPDRRAEGAVMFEGRNILSNGEDLNLLRGKIGMIFQTATPFPMSVYENVAWGIRLYERLSRSEMNDRVEHALQKAALWNEVKDRLYESGAKLSGGQQQRLCIARTIALKPKVILMDEPCSALDPVATAQIEQLIGELSQEYTVAIVTHNMQQAGRVSQFTAFLFEGRVIEFGTTEHIIENPTNPQTEAYITGRFG